MDDSPEQSYQEKKDERQGQKEKDRRAMKQKRFGKRIMNSIIAVVVIVAIGYGLFLLGKETAPEGEDFSRVIPLLQAGHVTAGSLPEYNSNPPTSGPHYAQTARSGFREEIIPDQNIVHNLEHGDIWIAYHPRVSDEIKEELKRFGAAKVIITPREANDTDIALAAWGRLDSFDIENNTLPKERIEDFIKRYANKGPERIPSASGGI